MNKTVFATDQIPPQSIQLLEDQGFKVIVWDKLKNGVITKSQIIEQAKGACALITMLCDQIDKTVIEQLSSVRIIAQYAVGHNNIDSKACTQSKIIVTNTPDVLSYATAELAMSLLMASARMIIPASDNVRNLQWKSWEPMGFVGKSLRGLNHGIIGLGRIGQEYAKLCKSAFGHTINYTGPNRKPGFEKEIECNFVELEDICAKSDVISIHCPLTPNTLKLLGEKQFKSMKKDVIIINTARGEIIDEEQLYQFLSAHPLASAGLDVTAIEPLPDDSPLRELENCLITPHIGSANYRSRLDMGNLVAKNIIAVLKDEQPLTSVNKI